MSPFSKKTTLISGSSSWALMAAMQPALMPWGILAVTAFALMVYWAIRWEITDRVATVWLHRPHRHNAWTGTMHTEFRQVTADLEHRDDVRAVVVTGTPPAFCVGGDSKALADHGERGGYDSGLPAEPACHQ